MEIKFISYVPAIVGLLSIGTFAFLNAKNRRNRVFFLLNLFLAAWLVCLFGADISSNLNVALWFFRFALFFSAAAFLWFFCFAFLFPYETKIRWTKLLFYLSPLVVVTFLSLTPWVVPSVTVNKYAAEPAHIHLIYSLSDIVGISYLLAGVGVILSKFKVAEAAQKQQIKFVLYGLAIALSVNIFTGDVLTLLRVKSDYVDAGGFSVFIFSLYVAYAIIRHGFLDIRLIVARAFAYILTLGTIAGIYSALMFGLITALFNLDAADTSQRVVYVIMAVFLAFTFQPIKQFFDRLSNRLFYRDSYDTQAFLDGFNKVLVATYELTPLLKKSAAIIEENLKPAYTVFGLKETQSAPRRIMGTNGHPTFTEADITFVRSLTPKMRRKLVVTDLLEEKYSDLQKVLQENDIAVIARLASATKEEGIGYLVLGPKKSGNPYSSQDLKNIEIVANELVIAIQNALRFEEIENFNRTLQAKVDEATRKLRRTNEKLKALDETKDDFISMASHQLRTPLTSVKGYISMVLEGDAGKINDTQRKLLEQSFFSSQRMVFLIADLLNVSRLRTGKFVIEPAPVNLADMVDQEMQQLRETAAGKDLTLSYEKPEHFPTLMLDETKTRQVIMNFADNAIYYTPTGGHIRVELRETPASIELRVVDDGIGVPKAEQHHLFTKFYRAGNARKARPDGTGLGLFMAKKVVVAQGGAVIFESEEGKGSTFGFVFSKSKLAPGAAVAPHADKQTVKA